MKWSSAPPALVEVVRVQGADEGVRAGLPHFRTLGLGKLVGEATGGHVIGTSSVRPIDGSYFGVPRTGVYTVKGINTEPQGVTPDVTVEQHPDQLAKGQDPQIDKAVEVLLQDVMVWNHNHGPTMARSPEDKPALPATPRP